MSRDTHRFIPLWNNIITGELTVNMGLCSRLEGGGRGIDNRRTGAGRVRNPRSIFTYGVHERQDQKRSPRKDLGRMISRRSSVYVTLFSHRSLVDFSHQSSDTTLLSVGQQSSKPSFSTTVL